ncbi:MAG: pantoate--beta-alanine ligase [Saprospiraceae bacterium]
MLVFTKVVEIKSYVEACRQTSKSIGFVPTMGALHAGHLDLMKKSRKENQKTICSIFVNPTQFNDKKDLDKYPKTLAADCLLLEKVGVDVVFAPGVEDIYPKNTNIPIPDLGGLDEVMEGFFRPGHFKGMAQVVFRFLDILKPDSLYMGQKDFQQFTIVQYVLHHLKSSVKLVVCKTKREKNGLAMSSRNQRLSLEMKEKAGLIYRTMLSVKKKYGKDSIESLLTYAQKRLTTDFFTMEYIMIVDGHSLKPITAYHKGQYAVICVALWAEGVRLIDNMILEKSA